MVYSSAQKTMQHSRRRFLTGVASFAFSYGLTTRFCAGQKRKGTRIILLGTKGGPRVGTSGRSNPSTLLLINNVPYVIDCGYGTSRQLLAAGVPLNGLRYIFITHHHSDHNWSMAHCFITLGSRVSPPALMLTARRGWRK
jgi:glyoxylase-like metal-dependent hydrolase (beta-lactamase superfamily II)